MNGGKSETLIRGGIYLARLDPVKKAEVGKIRPVAVLTSQIILNKSSPICFVCPLSSQSYPEFKSLHVELAPRDSLEVKSFALVEHCRSVGSHRILQPRLAQLMEFEVSEIIRRLNYSIQ